MELLAYHVVCVPLWYLLGAGAHFAWTVSLLVAVSRHPGTHVTVTGGDALHRVLFVCGAVVGNAGGSVLWPFSLLILVAAKAAGGASSE